MKQSGLYRNSLHNSLTLTINVIISEADDDQAISTFLSQVSVTGFQVFIAL